MTWEARPLGELCDVLDHKRKPVTKSDRVAGPFPYYGATGIQDYVAGYLFDEPLVLVGEDGAKWGPGEMSAFPVEGKVWVNNHAHVLRPHRRKLLDKWLIHYLNYADLTDWVSGVTVPKLNQGNLREIQVPLPPLSEQQRIVGILDEAFGSIATAKASVEKNLRNARALLAPIFGAVLAKIPARSLRNLTVAEVADQSKGSIRTGPFGSQLLHAEFVESGIAVLGIDNAVQNRFAWDRRRFVTREKYEQLRRYTVRPGDVIITIMGTCGRCAVVPDGIPLAINSKHLCCITLDRAKCIPGYLHAYFLHHPRARDFLAERVTGSIMEGLNMGIIKELPILLPSIDDQHKVIASFEKAREGVESLNRIFSEKLAALEGLKKSLLHHAFTGVLTHDQPVVGIEAKPLTPFAVVIPAISTTDLHAGILAIAYRKHEAQGNLHVFGHVKAEKIADAVERYLGIALGRSLVKDRFGPNDFSHLKKVEHRARMTNAFDFQRVDYGAYGVRTLHGFDRLVGEARAALGDRLAEVEALLDLMLPMDTTQAELFVTIYAGWNNLLVDGKSPTDEEIVYESRENWHPEKLKIPRERFFNAIQFLRGRGMIPHGKGPKVTARES